MSASTSPTWPPPRRWLPLAVAVQAVALMATAMWYVVLILTRPHLEGGGAWVSAVLMLVWGVLLLSLARGLRADSRWANGPTVVAQLFLVVGSWPLLMADNVAITIIAVLLMAWAVVIIVGVLRATAHRAAD